MKFTIDKRENLCILKLEEDKLLSTNAPGLKSQFVILNAEDYKSIVLDLESVKYVDSSGLSSILIGNRLCKDSKGTLVLTRLSPTVDKLIKISQLDSILNVVPVLEDAVKFIEMDELERDLRG